MNDAACWQAVLDRDTSSDGTFVYGVVSTGVFCRPSCPARRPLRENVQFFRNAEGAQRAGLRPCLRCRPLLDSAHPGAERIVRLCRFIERNRDTQVKLADLSRAAGISSFHLQRSFKGLLGITPREYLEARRMQALKEGLRQGRSVTDAMFEAGFGSSSRLYEKANGHLGMAPRAYQRGGGGTTIRYSFVETPLGMLVVAATGRGICAIEFGESRTRLRSRLQAQFAGATLIQDQGELRSAAGALRRHLDGGQRQLRLPLDIRATAFQQRVWKLLQAVPYGATVTYSDVARRLGQPAAARAVAAACAKNPVALAVPCHRVVRADGTPGGYRWGLKRKQILLSKEQQLR